MGPARIKHPDVRIAFAWSTLMLLILASSSLAGARHFGFLYEAPTSAPGSFELENWATWLRTTNPNRSDELAFRHEIEIGVTDRLQASIYIADWSYQDAHQN